MGLSGALNIGPGVGGLYTAIQIQKGCNANGLWPPFQSIVQQLHLYKVAIAYAKDIVPHFVQPHISPLSEGHLSSSPPGHKHPTDTITVLESLVHCFLEGDHLATSHTLVRREHHTARTYMGRRKES